MQQAILEIPKFETSIDLNYQTGDFFYDHWLVSSQFKNTVWEAILKSLPEDIGQARLIKLEPEECYRSHADIDDRYHLSIVSDNAYLVDLDNNFMHPTTVDRQWYLMDAGRRHSAVNFSGNTRIQLVVRKLLIPAKIENPQLVIVSLVKPIPNFRYIFDDIISPWLNKVNKQGQLNNFHIASDNNISFVIDSSCVPELFEICPSEFKITL